AFIAKKPGEKDFIDLIGKRRGGGIDHCWIAAKTNRQLHFSEGLPLVLKVARADFVQMPMHPGGTRVENLHAVETDVARALDRIFRKNHRQSDERPGITRPAG